MPKLQRAHEDPVQLETRSFIVDREVLEGMLDRARSGDDNDEIIDTTRGLHGVEDQGSGGVW